MSAQTQGFRYVVRLMRTLQREFNREFHVAADEIVRMPWGLRETLFRNIYFLLAPNRPFTLVFKKKPIVLRDTGQLMRRSNYKIFKERWAVGWGIPNSVPMSQASATTTFKKMTDLLVYVHGGEDLAHPRGKVRIVTQRMAKLFRLLWLVTRKFDGRRRPFRGRTKQIRAQQKDLRKGLTGRAAQLAAAARGNVIPPLKVGTKLVQLPRPFILETFRRVKPRAIKRIRRGIINIFKAKGRVSGA